VSTNETKPADPEARDREMVTALNDAAFADGDAGREEWSDESEAAAETLLAALRELRAERDAARLSAPGMAEKIAEQMRQEQS
jgi:hypothetical protein